MARNLFVIVTAVCKYWLKGSVLGGIKKAFGTTIKEQINKEQHGGSDRGKMGMKVMLAEVLVHFADEIIDRKHEKLMCLSFSFYIFYLLLSTSSTQVKELQSKLKFGPIKDRGGLRTIVMVYKSSGHPILGCVFLTTKQRGDVVFKMFPHC